MRLMAKLSFRPSCLRNVLPFEKNDRQQSADGGAVWYRLGIVLDPDAALCHALVKPLVSCPSPVRVPQVGSAPASISPTSRQYHIQPLQLGLFPLPSDDLTACPFYIHLRPWERIDRVGSARRFSIISDLRHFAHPPPEHGRAGCRRSIRERVHRCSVPLPLATPWSPRSQFPDVAP